MVIFMADKVITRFAPSPTGYLHVGGARTALFNYLHAIKNNGSFRLRIEDTDRKRSSDEMTRKIFNGLTWLGLPWDDKIVYQGANVVTHRKMAHSLLQQGLAYQCFCSPEELKINRADYRYNQRCRKLSQKKIQEYINKKTPYSIRFKVPTGKTTWFDTIHGQISVNNEEIEDFIILRSDGSPTYQLAVVVDDHHMEVNCVIRGDDHISNTPKQILLYQALGWNIPQFAHVPLILGPDKTRLSKRHGATALDDYIEKGVLPEAMFNYLVLLGWSPESDQEILGREEILKQFDLEKVSKKSAIFDEKKLAWINQQYIINQTSTSLFQPVTTIWKKESFLEENEITSKKIWLEKLIELLKYRAVFLSDFTDLARYFFRDPSHFDQNGIKKFFKAEDIWSILEKAYHQLKEIDVFHQDEIESTIRALAEREEVSAGKIIHPIRLALTGRTATPGLFEVMELLGKEIALNRLRKFLDLKNHLQQLMLEERV